MLVHRVFMVSLTLLLIFSTGAVQALEPIKEPTISPDASIKGGDLLAYNISSIEFAVGVSGKVPLINIGDGRISDIWEDVPETPVAPYGDSYGSIKTVWGESTVYFLITHDFDMPWVALEWDSNGNIDPEAITDDQITPMADGDDMWVFGNTSTTSFFGDLVARGQLPPFLEQDEQNDLDWEMVLMNGTEEGEHYFAWEFSRAMDTGDTAGADVSFSTEKNVTLILASEKEHRPDSKIEVFKYSLSDKLPGGAANITVTIPTVETPDNSSEVLGSFVLQGLGWGTLTTVITLVPTIFIVRKEEN